MKAKFALAILLWVALPARVFAADAPQAALTVAVCDFGGEGLAARHNGKRVAALITVDLTVETNLILLERANLNKVLNEQAFDHSGMVDADAAAKIGALTGAKVLVSGEVIETSAGHLAIVADIIGTETARLFAVKVEGPADKMVELASALSGQIAQTIRAQETHLVAPTEESHLERLNRIVAGIHGTNRPTVSVDITFYNETGGRWPDKYAEYEFGAVLLKAGFTVLDEHSDRKPDIEITGDASNSWGPERNNLVSSHTAIEVKVHQRLSGRILAYDRQEGTATGIGKTVVSRFSHVDAVDGLAERILPLLAK